MDFKTFFEGKGDYVSFDFDTTLKYSKDVTEALELSDSVNHNVVERMLQRKTEGYRIIIVTSRKGTESDKQEIREFIKENNLPVEQIYFTDGVSKIKILSKINPIPVEHYDDDEVEISDIQQSDFDIQAIDNIDGESIDLNKEQMDLYIKYYEDNYED